jgi:hypothetical protein
MKIISKAPKFKCKMVFKPNSVLVNCQFYHISPGVPNIEPVDINAQTG